MAFNLFLDSPNDQWGVIDADRSTTRMHLHHASSSTGAIGHRFRDDDRNADHASRALRFQPISPLACQVLALY